MSAIKFTKMHGLGNDFIVINNINQNINFSKKFIIALANRNYGIGCDQVLVLEKADKNSDKNIDFNYRIFNADGTEVGQCGNGARCLAKYIHDHQLSTKNKFRVKTMTSILELEYKSDQEITVNMGVPQDVEAVQVKLYSGLKLSIGNPHVVFKIDNLDNKTLNNLGLDDFNVEFMNVINKNHIKLRVFERGVGETEACGSGACAAVVAGIAQKFLEPNKSITVDLAGGKLEISWSGEANSPVLMTGPAVSVFEGEVSPEFI